MTSPIASPQSEVLTIFTDGGSRGNPGPAAIGVWVTTPSSSEPLYTQATTIGTATNNEAEYKAFLASLTWLEGYVKQHSVAAIEWYLDSQLVVEQLNRNWKIKEPRMLVLAQQIWVKLATLPCSYRIQAVRREFNKEADALVNQALDAQSW